MLDSIFLQAPVYLLIFGRIFAMLMVLPLFSMRAAPRIAKIALAGYMAFFILGTADLSVYKTYLGPDGVASLQFVLLLAGEVLIGVILGFFIQVIFSSFIYIRIYSTVQQHGNTYIFTLLYCRYLHNIINQLYCLKSFKKIDGNSNVL